MIIRLWVSKRFSTEEFIPWVVRLEDGTIIKCKHVETFAIGEGEEFEGKFVLKFPEASFDSNRRVPCILQSPKDWDQ